MSLIHDVITDVSHMSFHAAAKDMEGEDGRERGHSGAFTPAEDGDGAGWDPQVLAAPA